jgi:hypothetical protein
MFIDSVKLYVKFDDETLIDEITNNTFVATGTDLIVDILSGGLGYGMKHNQSLELSNFPFSISTDFSIGFWLYPQNQGQVINPDTGVITNLIMPLISFFSGTEPIIEITEISQSNDTNFLSIRLEEIYSATTEEYDVDMFHFVYISWKGETGSITIFIDGKEQVTTTSGTVVTSIGGATMNMFINKISETGFNITQNIGFIDDLVVFNDSKKAAQRSSNAINFSVDYIVDDTLVNLNESGQSFLFNDPATVRTTSMTDDLSFIYVARDDGKILRGSPLFWEVRKVFSENNEKDLIEETVLDNGSPSSLDGGFLKIESSVVRL